MSDDYTITDAKELFDEFGGPRPEWFDNPTPKQKENWQEHGASVLSDIDDERSQWWYLRTYRPKKRGDGMMKRDHVQIGTPEYYFIKTAEGLKRPMSSIQGEVMASFGVSGDTQKEVEKAAAHMVRATTSDAEKARMAKEADRLSNILGV